MREIPEPLAAHLAGSVTTLCHCWRVTRRDGAVLGFTDHDRDLDLAGTPCAARTGLEAAEAASELGFAVGGGEFSGALDHAGLTEDDLAAGLYDGAAVETWLVNWAEPGSRLLLDTGTIGEVRREDGAFVAEVRGLMHRLDERRGRLYGAACSAELGDRRCRVPLGAPAYTATAGVTATDGALTLVTDGLAAFAEGWFTGGRLTWLTGANAELGAEIRAHRSGALAELELWGRPARAVAAGDTFRVTAGCDKRFATCRDRFANTPNFQGFPHMPGNDYVVRVPREGEAGLDGGSLFR